MRKTIKLLTTIFILAAIAVFSSSCGNKMKEAKEQAKNATNMIKNLSKVEKESEDVNSKMEELKTKEPFSNDKFKAWMPEELNGIKRTSFQFSTSMGNIGELTFQEENGEKYFHITIIDGAGETGSMIYASQSFVTGFMNNYESESDTKVEKIIERKGSKALQTIYKEENTCNIQAVMDDRFIVNVESNNIGIDDTWKMIDKLDIGKLK